MMRAFRPTLVRRVFLALLVAFSLVWIVLLGRDFLQAKDAGAFDAKIRAVADNLLASIAPLDSDAYAGAVVASNAALINEGYRDNRLPDVLMELRDAGGARVYVSPQAERSNLQGPPGSFTDGSVNGQPYRLYHGRHARWSLTVAAPKLSTWSMFRLMGGSLTLDMLIAFPLVLVPVWIAVRRGLRPLRTLSDRIAARGPDDLNPLGVAPRHAELQPLAGALDSLLDQLRRRLARERGFVQDAAHELRTPLAVMSAQAHVLVMATDPGERERAGRHMIQAMNRASHMIEQLLDMAKIDGGKPAVPDEFDVAELVRTELALLAPAALARHIDLVLDAPDTLRWRLDLHAFQAILHNLVSNAIAYIRERGRVDVTLWHDGSRLTLAVADDGPGIPPGERALVFERFYRGAGHDMPGAGLGLAIVREAAARLGGGVGLEDSIDGKGCRFVVTIPLENHHA
jgi:two-component system, OmpR family, sensor histidine kinase QseC